MIIRASAVNDNVTSIHTCLLHLIVFRKFLLLYLKAYRFTIFHSFLFFYFRVGLKTKFSSIFIFLNRFNICLSNEMYNTEPLKIIENLLVCIYTASFKITKGDCSKIIKKKMYIKDELCKEHYLTMSIIIIVTNNIHSY